APQVSALTPATSLSWQRSFRFRPGATADLRLVDWPDGRQLPKGWHPRLVGTSTREAEGEVATFRGLPPRCARRRCRRWRAPAEPTVVQRLDGGRRYHSRRQSDVRF